nr:hypothetical protein [Tanacetum cinerariifolium]
ASQLTRLEIASCKRVNETWTEALKKFSSLEELSLHNTIQYLKLPNDSLNGCSYVYETENDYNDFGVDYPDGPYDYCPDDYEDLESFLRRTQPKSKSDCDNEWMIMDYYSLL